jgi:O-antigen/teichoic acid export membrane protein
VWSDERAHAASTARALVLLKSATAALMIGPALVFSAPLAPLLLTSNNAVVLLQIALLGVLLRAVAGAFSAILQALRVFQPLIVAQLVNAMLTLRLMAGLFAGARPT